MSELHQWAFVAYWVTKEDLESSCLCLLSSREDAHHHLVSCGAGDGAQASWKPETTELRPSLDVLYDSAVSAVSLGNRQPSRPRFCGACFEMENSLCSVPTAALSLASDQSGTRCLPYYTQLSLSGTDQKQGEA